MNDVLLQVLAADKELITYRKELNKITGSVMATILLQQLIFHASQKKYEPFYKFIEPCNNELYREGDSWTEELGFTKYEFKTAYKKLEDIGVVTKSINMNRVTFYKLNRFHLGKLIMSTYEESITIEKELSNYSNNKVPLVSRESKLTYFDNVNLDNSKIKEQRILEEDEEEINLKYLDDYIEDITQNKKTIKGSYTAYRAGVIDALTDFKHKRHAKTIRSYKDYIKSLEAKNELPTKPLDLLKDVIEINVEDFKDKNYFGVHDKGIISTVVCIGFNTYEITYNGLGVHQTQKLVFTETMSSQELVQRISEYTKRRQ